MLLGKRLKELRKAKGMTQQELGDLINVTKVSVCCYEKETRTPTLDTLLDLCNVFNVNVDYLLGNDVQLTAKNDSNLTFTIAKEEIDIIKELRNHIKVYEKFVDDPKRMVDFVEKKLR